jgi:hypothetical protein
MYAIYLIMRCCAPTPDWMGYDPRRNGLACWPVQIMSVAWPKQIVSDHLSHRFGSPSGDTVRRGSCTRGTPSKPGSGGYMSIRGFLFSCKCTFVALLRIHRKFLGFCTFYCVYLSLFRQFTLNLKFYRTVWGRITCAWPLCVLSQLLQTEACFVARRKVESLRERKVRFQFEQRE